MKSSQRWAWIVSLVAATGAALVLAFRCCPSAPPAAGFYERHFVWLFWINVAVAMILALVIGLAVLRLAVRCARQVRQPAAVKLAGIFALWACCRGW